MTRFRRQALAVAVAATLFAPQAAGARKACDFGAPRAGMPAAFAQYGFLIGDFEIRIHLWLGDRWSDQYRTARWTGRYILGGRAIMDEWYPFDPEANPETPGGVNIRMYDADEDLWKLMWMRSDQLVPTALRSKVEADGKMHLWRVYPTPETRKIVFETYGKDRWARFDYARGPDGGDWVPKYKYEARRRPCG